MAIRNCKVTNRAVKTSILSKPWKYLLPQITRTQILYPILFQYQREVKLAIYEIGFLISLSIEMLIIDLDTHKNKS